MSFSAFQVGPEAWVAGRLAIVTQTFVFQQTADDMAYQALKQCARAEAERYLATLSRQDLITNAERTRLFFTYVHAFVIGALDELSHNTLL
jgi:hypothetical protein